MKSQRAMGNLVRLWDRFLVWLWWDRNKCDKNKKGWSYEITKSYGSNSPED